ncbi:MAG: ABC transporter substrate-binding protein [Kiritimatiellia bacterium]|jgi:phospholipid transport system substrate-binding protein|nr:ABC transporter substrate-binding protein [Kiritimatiellia bacterium]
MGRYRAHRLGCSLLAVCVVATVLRADDRAEVSRLTKDTADALTKVLRQKDLARAEKLEKVTRIVDPIFDYKSMAMLTLGRTNWKRLSQDERKEFSDLFVKQLERAYFDKAEYLSDQVLQIDEPVSVKGKMHVATRVDADGKPMTVKYKYYKSSGGWMVYDVEVEGISLISSYRSQYTQILKDGTVADLLGAMRAKSNERPSE